MSAPSMRSHSGRPVGAGSSRGWWTAGPVGAWYGQQCGVQWWSTLWREGVKTLQSTSMVEWAASVFLGFSDSRINRCCAWGVFRSPTTACLLAEKVVYKVANARGTSQREAAQVQLQVTEG